MKKQKAATTLAVFLAALPAGGAMAGEVELSTRDGRMSFRGELVAHDAELYTLKTSLGTLAFPAGDVICTGADCPAGAVPAEQAQAPEPVLDTGAFRMAGAPGLLRLAMPDLVDAYSLTVDTDIARDRNEAEQAVFALSSFSGEPVVDITLVEASPAAALTALSSGDAALALLPRPMSRQEAEAMDAPLSERLLATGAVVPLVGASVPVRSLDVEDLAGIFSGRIDNWAALGGPDAPIDAFVGAAGSEARSVFEETVLAPRGLAMHPGVKVLDMPGGFEAALADHPAGIALAGFDAAQSPAAIAVIDACGRPVPADPFTLKSGRYPMASPVFAYARETALPTHAAGLLDFTLSPDGQALLPDTGYADTQPVLGLAGRFFDRGATTTGARPLSLRFAVTAGTGSLGAGAKDSLTRLADYLTQEEPGSQEVVFVGLGRDQAAGLAAARAVAGALFDAAPAIEADLSIAFSVAGTAVPPCEMAPDTAVAVEVWVRPLRAG